MTHRVRVGVPWPEIRRLVPGILGQVQLRGERLCPRDTHSESRRFGDYCEVVLIRAVTGRITRIRKISKAAA